MVRFKTPRGTRDFLPEETAKRREAFEKIRKVFECYGYGEVCTPAFEDFKLLSKKSGPDIEKEIYVFKDKNNRKLGLRFDPTVPICRIVASNPTLAKPIRFYYITNMWRYDRPSANRWREFWQCGVELIGSDRVEADAEMLSLVSDSLKAMGIRGFYFRVNSRGIIEELIKKAGIPEKKKFDAFRAIDKLGKIGEEAVKKEAKGYGIPSKGFEKLLSLIKGRKVSPGALKGLRGIKKLAEKIGVKNIGIDFSIVRGIDYYTGFVFETFVKGFEALGSIASGGRYDTLIGLYGNEDMPATGFGIGIDRLMETVKAGKAYCPARVCIVPVNDKLRNDAAKVAGELRKKGISCVTDLMGRNIRKQLEYVNSMKIPYAIFLGPREAKSGRLTLRDMKTGKESSLKISGIIKRLK